MTERSRHTILPAGPVPLSLAALLGAALLAAACSGGDGDGGGLDSSTLPDADRDADGDADVDGESDAEADGEADLPDAERAAALEGQVRFLRRPMTASGLGPAEEALAGSVSVRLVVDGVEVARGAADDEGRFAFDLDGLGADEAEVRAVTTGEAPRALEVRDFDGAAYAVLSPPVDLTVAGAVDLVVDEEANAGAFAIFETVLTGLEVAEEALSRETPLPFVGARWERGREPPGGTSYLDGSELWLLGGPVDTDDQDPSVVLHEMGHWVESLYSFTSFASGYPHSGAETDPRLAWSEGWATFFSCMVLDDPSYRDSVGSRLGLDIDISRLPASGEYAADPSGGMDQTLSEWLVAGTLWQLLLSEGSRAEGRARAFEVVTGWLGRSPTPDRGARGYDMVDDLDGALCLHGAASEAAVQTYLVEGRGFPYDLAPPCAGAPPGKPGRPVRLPLVMPAPDGVDRGAFVVTSSGERLRQVRLAP